MNRRRAIKTATAGLLLAMTAGNGPAAASQSGKSHGAAGWQLAASQRAIPWATLSREEQQLLNKHRGSWQDYTPERQDRLRSGARRYLTLPPEKRENVEREHRRYEKLNPRQRQQLRDEYRRQQR
jgi:hypothetical protein